MHVKGTDKQADHRISTSEIIQAVRSNSDLPVRAWGGCLNRCKPRSAARIPRSAVLRNTPDHATAPCTSRSLPARSAALRTARAPRLRPQRAESKCTRGAAPSPSLAPLPCLSRAIRASLPAPHAHRRVAHRRCRRQPQQNAILFGRLLPNRRRTDAILFYCCSVLCSGSRDLFRNGRISPGKWAGQP